MRNKGELKERNYKLVISFISLIAIIIFIVFMFILYNHNTDIKVNDRMINKDTDTNKNKKIGLSNIAGKKNSKPGKIKSSGCEVSFNSYQGYRININKKAILNIKFTGTLDKIFISKVKNKDKYDIKYKSDGITYKSQIYIIKGNKETVYKVLNLSNDNITISRDNYILAEKKGKNIAANKTGNIWLAHKSDSRVKLSLSKQTYKAISNYIKYIDKDIVSNDNPLKYWYGLNINSYELKNDKGRVMVYIKDGNTSKLKYTLIGLNSKEIREADIREADIIGYMTEAGLIKYNNKFTGYNINFIDNYIIIEHK